MGQQVAVRLLGKDYRFDCPPGQEAALVAAGKLLDQHLREAKKAHRAAAPDEVALIAALNLAHELQADKDAWADTLRRLKECGEKMAAANDG